MPLCRLPTLSKLWVVHPCASDVDVRAIASFGCNMRLPCRLGVGSLLPLDSKHFPVALTYRAGQPTAPSVQVSSHQHTKVNHFLTSAHPSATFLSFTKSSIRKLYFPFYLSLSPLSGARVVRTSAAGYPGRAVLPSCIAHPPCFAFPASAATNAPLRCQLPHCGVCRGNAAVALA